MPRKENNYALLQSRSGSETQGQYIGLNPSHTANIYHNSEGLFHLFLAKISHFFAFSFPFISVW